MVKLVIRVRAKLELDAAYGWYHPQSPIAARRFFEEMTEALNAIQEAPNRFPIVSGHLRRFQMTRFPYAIYFKIYPKFVSILRVIHNRRNVDDWMRRSGN